MTSASPVAAGESLVPQLAIVLAALLWGLWWIPVRGLEAGGLSGDWVSVALYGVGALGLLPFLLASWARKRDSFWRGAGSAVLAGLFCGVALAFWNHALLVGEVVRVTLLFYTAPIWSTLLAAAFLGERLSLRRGVTIALGLSGAAVVLGFTPEDGLSGLPLPQGEADWMAIGASVTFAISTTLIRKSGAGNSGPQSFVSLVGGALVALVLAVLDPASGGAPAAPEIGLEILPQAAAVGLFWLLPSLWLILWGAGRIDPGRVAILLLLEVVAAAVSAAVLTAEPFGGREVLGCLLILAAGLTEATAGRPLLPGVLLRRRGRLVRVRRGAAPPAPPARRRADAPCRAWPVRVPA